MTAASKWEIDYASWTKLARELRKRTVEPTRHVSFVIYFLVAVVMFGGLGIWISSARYWFFVPTAEHPYPQH